MHLGAKGWGTQVSPVSLHRGTRVRGNVCCMGSGCKVPVPEVIAGDTISLRGGVGQGAAATRSQHPQRCREPGGVGGMGALRRVYGGAVLQLCKLELGKIESFPKPGNTETFPFQPLFLHVFLSQHTQPRAFRMRDECLGSYPHRSGGRIPVPSQRLCSPACGCRPPCPPAQLPAARAKGAAPALCNGNPPPGG